MHRPAMGRCYFGVLNCQIIHQLCTNFQTVRRQVKKSYPLTYSQRYPPVDNLSTDLSTEQSFEWLYAANRGTLVPGLFYLEIFRNTQRPFKG